MRKPGRSAGLDQPDRGLAHSAVERVRGAMASVEAAALAGAAAALLLALSTFLLRRQPGVGSSSAELRWYSDSGNRLTVMVGLTVAPLGVVALLWFMAVIRRRLGDREDRFLATVFLGSGVAFAVLTMAAAVAAALPTLVVWSGDRAQPDRATLELAHALWFGLFGICGSRLVGVFMTATSVVGFRFGAFPGWLSTFGTIVGVALGLTGAFAGPLDFLFPVWLLVVSLTLVVNGRTGRARPIDSDIAG